MFINTAKNFNTILNNYEEGKADPGQVEFVFQMHRDSAKFYLDNSNVVPNRENYQEAAGYVLETTGVMVTVEEITGILKLSPSARIKLAVYEGCSDTEVRDLIYDAACGFFAGCEAPTYGDNMDNDRFVSHLQDQARKMGYKVR
jgi:hypothetical protein